MLEIAKSVIGLAAGTCGGWVVQNACKAVLPEAVTITEKIVRTTGLIAAGCAINYATQKYVENTVDTFVNLADAIKQVTKKDDCVVE